jgi:N-methylhydantoinase A
VPVAGGDITEAGLQQLVVDFHDGHERSFHFRLEVPIEVVGFHLAAFGVVEQPAIARVAAGSDSAPAARKGERTVALAGHGKVTAEVYDRTLLGAGAELSGPAIVEEHAATTLVLPGQRLRVEEFGSLIIEEEL